MSKTATTRFYLVEQGHGSLRTPEAYADELGYAITALDLAKLVNDAVVAGAHVTVNGTEVYSQFRKSEPATSWQNGTFSYDIRNKTGNRSHAIYVKTYHSVSVSISE